MYKSKDLVKVAKRYNNPKRSYLLVNPLQAKHLPVSPNKALELMQALGDKVAAKYFDTKLVIGFAETATAIGAIVAESLAKDCIYVHTTREYLTNRIEFLEEHSHAPEQFLYKAKLNEWLANTSTVVFVDDELSTGKTLLNMIRQMKLEYPAFAAKRLVVSTIINRLSEENEHALLNEGIECEYLIKIATDIDVSNIEVSAAQIVEPTDILNVTFHQVNFTQNPRYGVYIHDYIDELMHIGNDILKLIGKFESVLLLGAEECMLPAIISGKIIEDSGISVVTHSITRSPIGISNSSNYPINEGYQFESFYNAKCNTYIYNLKYYELIIVLCDVRLWHDKTVRKLLATFNTHGYGQVMFIGRK